MRTHGLFLLSLVAFTTSCVNVRDRFRPVLTDAPFVYDIGELAPINEADLTAAQEDLLAIPESVHYGQLGAGVNPGIFGGATLQFAGTGGNVCVIVDPESMFWNKQISTQSNTVQYKYDDIYTDDGDIDVSVGLTAYYTGSPGQEIGDFEAEFTDASGVPHQLEFNECVQTGYFGDPAHAGRGTVEYCQIDTSLRPGVMYTAVLETFALPIDDSILNFGVMVFDGNCQDVPWVDQDGGISNGPTECVLPNEVGNADPNGLPDDKAWFPELESAYCTGKPAQINSYCKDNPGQGCQEEDIYVE
jgi:hypothetical protein